MSNGIFVQHVIRAAHAAIERHAGFLDASEIAAAAFDTTGANDFFMERFHVLTIHWKRYLSNGKLPLSYFARLQKCPIIDRRLLTIEAV